ncbi:DUF1194 domain-containing protein [Chelatococcus reniformis]|uniref:DUF1194 domain-containing protein n=1 Tax=Chelatococcus reniformis TaxID=1494448 RepID=A0A916X6U0_9HYPH|nr:DUF1194 domain-containing protein [Chelatococcus reniformis]GGC46657.1 hypothetical protein GCM10010994_02240 [Chelatococcus reniformis]
MASSSRRSDGRLGGSVRLGRRSGLRLVLGLATLAIGLALTAVPRTSRATDSEVDVALVLAVDISFSMDEDEQRLQRAGYVQALQSPAFLDAVRKGLIGRIAVTFVEWAGTSSQHVVVPWQIIDGPESADRFVSKLIETPPKRAYRTSISGGIDFAARQFDSLSAKALRRVIDVSGDGPNNQGRSVTLARDEAVARGIIINGLPLMLKEPGYLDIVDLDRYYERCVIGGPGAFMIPVRERGQFVEATRNKLLQEVSNHGALIVPAADGGPAVSCLVGERQWDERMGN